MSELAPSRPPARGRVVENVWLLTRPRPEREVAIPTIDHFERGLGSSEPVIPLAAISSQVLVFVASKIRHERVVNQFIRSMDPRITTVLNPPRGNISVSPDGHGVGTPPSSAPMSISNSTSTTGPIVFRDFAVSNMASA